MSRRHNLPPALQSEDFDLPEWMEFGFQHLRVPDHYWKYFPEHIQHRFKFADYAEGYAVPEHVPITFRRLLRRYLHDKGIIDEDVRLRRKKNKEFGPAFDKMLKHLGADFIERYYDSPHALSKKDWAGRIRAHRAPLEFAQPEELGNIWPEALIAQVQLDYHFKSAVFEEHRMTPEKQAEEDYYNAVNDTKWFNEHIDLLLDYLKHRTRARKIAPYRMIKRWALAPKTQSGLALSTKRYDHSIYKNLPKYIGPRAWHYIQSFFDPKTRKHTLIHRDELMQRIDDDRPAPPPIPPHLEALQAEGAPMIFDDNGNVIPVRYDASRGGWVDDFGDPVEVPDPVENIE